MIGLKQLPSSAGVPNSTTFPGKSCFFIVSAAARAPDNDAVAIKLWPHACPISCRASVIHT